MMPHSTTISFQERLKDHNGDVSQLLFSWGWSLSASQYTRVPAPTYATTVAEVKSTSLSAPLATDDDEAQVNEQTCTYDYMGRRATKKVEEITTDAEGNETTAIISNHRFIYCGYLQIGCCDLTRANHPCLWLITWDPTQPVATRPLAIQKDGTWYAYGWDLTKNICEIFGQNGYIRSTYAYTPFGSVTANGDINQLIQWSCEYYDNELALVYYNYRYYNPTDGRWINRDPITEQGGRNMYGFVRNSIFLVDDLGKRPDGFYDLSLSIGALDRETLNKLKNVINELNKLKDKCYRRCYDVTLNVKPITKEELFNFSIKYDLVILMTNSEGFPDEFYIQIKDGEKLHSNDIPKNVKAYGCHLAGKREFYYKGRKFYANPGNRKNPMGQLYLMIQMIEYLESLKMKAECKTIFKIVLLTTVR